MPGWDQYEPDVRARLEQVRGGLLLWAGAVAQSAERDMKRNAPWTDQTGNARNGLYARPFEAMAGNVEDYQVGVILGHTVSYGIWLEVRWNGRFAIVGPTATTYRPRFVAGAREIVGNAMTGRGGQPTP